MAYIVKEVKGQGISLRSLKGGETVRFDVVFEGDGRRVWMGNEFFANDVRGRHKNGLRLAASKVAKRYNDHLARTGNRFEHAADFAAGEDFFSAEKKIIANAAEEKTAREAFDLLRKIVNERPGPSAERIRELAAGVLNIAAAQRAQEVLLSRSSPSGSYVRRFEKVRLFEEKSGLSLLNEVKAAILGKG